jgi:hypothetical protein
MDRRVDLVGYQKSEEAFQVAPLDGVERMIIGKVDDGRICILLRTEERNIISNCMNYLCNGRPPADFNTLVDPDVEEPRALLDLLVSV